MINKFIRYLIGVRMLGVNVRRKLGILKATEEKKYIE